MSMPDANTTEPERDAPLAPERLADGRVLVALIVDPGVEPPASLTDQDAQAAWCAVSALWHPSLLARAVELPRIENVDCPSSPGPNEIRIVVAGAIERLPSGYQVQAEDAGTILIEAGLDRDSLVREIQERLGAVGTPETTVSDEMTAAARDFLALGTAHWWIKDLTAAMGHADGLDHESLTREVLAGASAWQISDRPTASNRLRAGFELLTQARERFYPVDAYIIDLCLLNPAMSGGVLAAVLDARAPFTLLAPARAIENQASRDPERIAGLRDAINEGWADVVGGAFDEVDEPLLPLESIFWQFRKGGEVYRSHLESRNVETVARRRFGLYPQLPQIAKRFGFRFAVHLGFDAGRFPIRAESKRLWESPDGTSLETLTRPPLAADKPSSGAHLPWRLALTMKDDHVATLPLIHWPNVVAPWFEDLRRVAGYSPVLARWVTLNDYFHLTDRPYEAFRPEPDEYVTPYLAQALARKDTQPISRRAEHVRLRARFEALGTVRALCAALQTSAAEADDPSSEVLEEAIETGRLDEACEALNRQEPAWASALARGIIGSDTTGRPGYLVFNPIGVARRIPVLLPDAALDLRPEGPLRVSQFTDEGVWGVVDLPAFGFAWVPRESDPGSHQPAVLGLSARDRVLRNESIAVEIDKATGGIRGLHAAAESTARLGQQLVLIGPATSDSTGAPSRMVADRVEIEYAGPALVQAIAEGTLVGRGDEPLASFRQRYRLWSGRPTLELEIALSNLSPSLVDQLADAAPWSRGLACRWAWPDSSSMLRRTCLLSPELTEADLPETPDAFDISTRRQRTALLFGGLAHHRRHGARMLDTLLVVGRESEQRFTLGVVLDLEHPFHAVHDLMTPALVVPTETGPPSIGTSGWFFHLDHKSVAVTHVEHLDSSGDGRGWGFVFHLIETSGSSARCRLRLFRNPVWARQVDFNNEAIVDLPLDGDAVLIDLTPHEIARIDVTLG